MRIFLHVIVWTAFLCFCASALAQRAHDQVWISAGAGLTARELFLGASQGLTVSYNSNSLFVSGRYVNADRLGTLNFSGPSPYLDYFQEYSLNFGYAKHTESGLYLASVGVGELRGKYNKERQNASFNTLCIPLTGQVLWKLSQSFGIGPTFSFNLNGKEIFAGVWFNLQVMMHI